MDKEKVIENAFIIRAKDELGQYLDDEQAWRDGMPFTSQMLNRLNALYDEAVSSVVARDEWSVARKLVELILRRRGGAEYKEFKEGNKEERAGGCKIYVKTDESRLKLEWYRY